MTCDQADADLLIPQDQRKAAGFLIDEHAASVVTMNCGRRAMRHEAMITTLRSLKLFGMAHAVAELGEQGGPAFNAAQGMLSDLLKAEIAERDVRSVAYQMKIARFPAYRDLTGFDFSQSVANEALARQLHRCEFMEQAHHLAANRFPADARSAACGRGEQKPGTVYLHSPY